MSRSDKRPLDKVMIENIDDTASTYGQYDQNV